VLTQKSILQQQNKEENAQLQKNQNGNKEEPSEIQNEKPIVKTLHKQSIIATTGSARHMSK